MLFNKAKLKRKLKRTWKKKPVQVTRSIVQIAFATFLLYVGFEFYQFYIHFASFGTEPYVERPTAVEGFLPISALVALRVWLTTWSFDQIHPAGLVLFTFFVASGFFFRKTFCSWICPIGTLSEWTGRIGKKIFKRNFEPPKWLAVILSSLKYLILIWFIKMVIEMPIFFAESFLNSSYNKVSDVKMLLFFINISTFSLVVILSLFVISLFVKNFWCRFLCPYGALIGIGSLFGITTINRNEKTCIDCNQCTLACPQGIKVSEQKQVHSLNCSACMHCVEACPVKDTLYVSSAGRKISKWAVPVTFFILFFSVVFIAKATDHWETNITYDEYKELILFIDDVGF